MNSASFIRNIDNIGEERHKDRLFNSLVAISNFIVNAKEQPDAKFPHKNLICAKSSLFLDYAIKRAVMGATVDIQSSQRNYLHAAVLLLRHFAAEVDLTKFTEFVSQTFAIKNTVNRTEKYFFNFAKLNLLVAVLDILKEIKLAEKEKVEAAVVQSIQQTIRGESLARHFLAALMEIRNEMTRPFFLCVQSVIKNLSASAYQDAEFAIVVKNILAEAVDKDNSEVPKKDLTTLVTQVNNFVKEFYDAKSLLKLFENINRDENIKGQEQSLKIYTKLARLMISHSDGKLHTLISLGKTIAGSKDKKSDGLNFANKLFQLILLASQIFENCASLDHYLHLAISKNLTEDFKQMLILIFEQKYSRNKNVAAAFNSLEKVLLRALRESEDSSKNFGQFLLRLMTSNESLSKIHFGLKEYLLKQEYCLPVVKELIDDCDAKIDQALKSGSLNNLKSAVTNYCSLFAPVADLKLALHGYKKLFLLYKRVPAHVETMTEELQQHTSEYLSTALYNFLFQKIIHSIFRMHHQPILGQLVQAWMKVNAVEDEFSNYSLSEELLAKDSEGSKTLGLLNLILLVQNYKSKDRDIESLIFNQSMEDIAIFSQKIATTESTVDASDLEVLTDVLISLMNIPSNDVRRVVNATFTAFAEFTDENCFELIENAIFKDQKENGQDEEEEDHEEDDQEGESAEDEDGDDDEEDGELDDEDDEDDEDDDEEEIILDGKLL
jgi:hypothetical protein